ncbi:hypothetical protein LWI28_018055 [Acer negundo]|uniref:Uncharacterized protein n=1 Tax=Acer negundo TaxID=4023 RepID=A0AAD5I6L9_ACENE|nr:hypothetical protein LWI28_018055 [Acer negundo]KAK4850088.1 hypothetical protein QYF36_003765 [Acer negundo]
MSGLGLRCVGKFTGSPSALPANWAKMSDLGFRCTGKFAGSTDALLTIWELLNLGLPMRCLPQKRYDMETAQHFADMSVGLKG